MDLLIDSNVPQGAGLSSSAALEVSIAGAFDQANGLGLTSESIAILSQQAENDFMDCQCGIMDQLISVKGQKDKALMIDCLSLETVAVPIADDISVMIINSNYPRKLVESEYNQRRLDCEQASEKLGVKSLRFATLAQLAESQSQLSENEYKRAYHVISENSRVLAAVDALTQNNMPQLQQLMQQSHYSLKHHFEVTVPETDGLVDICERALEGRGAVRMTGGGFGGAIVCLCRAEDIMLVKQAVADNYQKQFKLQADIFVCQAGNGLAILLND
jgi:galactokinase